MELTDQRELAEQALAGLRAGTEVGPQQWPGAADRICDARRRRGRSDVQVADRAGITISSYCDLEACNDEAFTVLSLTQLARLGHVLDVSPHVLLFGEGTAAPKREVALAEIAERLGDRMASEGLGVDEFGERVGWDLAEVLASPEALWRLNLVGLRDVCNAVNLDWVAALPGLQSSPPLSSR